jgi:hypothetical protein
VTDAEWKKAIEEFNRRAERLRKEFAALLAVSEKWRKPCE